MYIYMDCVNVTIKSAQHAHARMVAYIIDSAAPSLLTSISVSSWPCPYLNFGLPCIHTPLVSVNGGSKGYLDVSL